MSLMLRVLIAGIIGNFNFLQNKSQDRRLTGNSLGRWWHLRRFVNGNFPHFPNFLRHVLLLQSEKKRKL